MMNILSNKNTSRKTSKNRKNLYRNSEYSSNTQLVYVGNIDGLGIFDPIGDQLGTLKDIVVYNYPTSGDNEELQVVGIILQLPMKKNLFVPITKVLSITNTHITISPFLNLKSFKQRTKELLIIANLFDRKVKTTTPNEEVTILDIGIEKQKNNDWVVSKVFAKKSNSEQGGAESKIIDSSEILSFSRKYKYDNAKGLVDSWGEQNPTDLADSIMKLDLTRRMQVIKELNDEKLADVLEELDEKDQIEIIKKLPEERSVDIVQLMQPDDAADLIHELDPSTAINLLEKMEQDDANDIMQLLKYPQNSAGGIMTNNAIVLSPEAYVSEALAHISKKELPPSIASAVMITRPPHETPTGHFLGAIHFQELLRVPPHMQLGEIVDNQVPIVMPDESIKNVKEIMTAYNQLFIPVVDKEKRLLGIITVDDVLDYLKIETDKGKKEAE